VLSIPILSLTIACEGGDGNQPTATTRPEVEVTIVTDEVTPTLDAATTEVPEIGEDCIPLGPDTDEVYQEDVYADLIMKAAEIQEYDLPVDSLSKGRTISPIHNNGWNNRRRMAKADPNPLPQLETLRSLGVVGEWSNSRELQIGPIMLIGFPELLPLHFVEVRTVFFDSQACAYKFLAEDVGGEDLQVPSVPFETKGIYSRSVLGDETKTEFALFVPPSYVVNVTSYYRPALEDMETYFPGFYEDYPEATANIQRASNPDFVNVRSLGETLANRLWQQAVITDG
jgi:hypothetical protein